MNVRRALVVFAHPDDAEFGIAGTVATWTGLGAEVVYVSVTDGSGGSNEVGADREELRSIREAEQREACDVLGVRECVFLGWRDGSVEPTMDLRRAITREARRVRPDVLVSPDPTRMWDEGRGYVNHPDHRAVGIACLAVVNPDAPTRLQFPELLEEGLEPFEIPNLWIPTYEGEADTFVDISDTIDTKIRALRCHRSQVQDRPVDQWLRDRAEERGGSRGIRYAEAFKTFRLKDEETE